MRHDLTRPCDGCPFRRDGSGVKLHRERIREIHETTRQGIAFACHKTTEHYDDDELDVEAAPRPPRGRKLQQCAGAFSYALTVGDALARVVIQIRLASDVEKLRALERGQRDVYGSLDEWQRKGSI